MSDESQLFWMVDGEQMKFRREGDFLEFSFRVRRDIWRFPFYALIKGFVEAMEFREAQKVSRPEISPEAASFPIGDKPLGADDGVSTGQELHPAFVAIFGNSVNFHGTQP